MKSILRGILMGVVILLMVSSCATAPKELPAPGEVRLSGIKFEDFGLIRKGVQYVVEMKFESDGEVDVRRACVYWDDSGPSCYNILDITYGTRTIRVVVGTPSPGRYIMKGFVQFAKDGRQFRSNVVQTAVEIVN